MKRKSCKSGLRLLPIFFFVIILSGNVSSYSVDPVFDKGEFYQNHLIQFELSGDANQTNISCKVQYYYQIDPLSNEKKVEAVRQMYVPRLDANGTGVFQFLLNETNGFDRVGGYNLTFFFGYDVLNESGIETWTAPRAYSEIMVNLNQQAIIDAEKEDDDRDLAIMLGWQGTIGNILTITVSIIAFLLIVIILMKIHPVNTYRKIKKFLTDVNNLRWNILHGLRIRKALDHDSAIAYDLEASVCEAKSRDIMANELMPLKTRFEKSANEWKRLQAKKKKYDKLAKGAELSKMQKREKALAKKLKEVHEYVEEKQVISASEKKGVNTETKRKVRKLRIKKGISNG